ncbi:hypothetical protein [Echinicola vietnamensis]|nr:hypothetical protein [Echinicola vietnamensis]
MAVYSKGMGEEEKSRYDFETLEGRMEAYRATERFVQVFDLKGNVLADIQCPKGMLLGDVVNGNGQWVMTKDQAFFGQEQDWQTIYMLELVSK